jgi:hypothetical protein
MKDEFTNLMHLDFFEGEERTSLAVHCWFEQVSKGGDPIYWLENLELTYEQLNKYRGNWGNEWREVDLVQIFG